MNANTRYRQCSVKNSCKCEIYCRLVLDCGSSMLFTEVSVVEAGVGFIINMSSFV